MPGCFILRVIVAFEARMEAKGFEGTPCIVPPEAYKAIVIIRKK